MKGKSIEQYVRKWRKAASQVLQFEMWCSSCSWDEEIPKDVPKGHFVVYVGEEWKRYVIEIALLKHPLFRTLLDSAEEMFGFAYGPKLYLPCKEYVFVGILQYVGSHTKPDNFTLSGS